MKYIVIDGKKYQVDPSDSTKALLGADGQPVPYVEDTPPTTKSLEERAKDDPELAAVLAEKKRLEDEAAERERLAEEERQKQLAESGDFKKIAEEATTKAEKAQQKVNETNAVLGEYKETLKGILDDMLAQIPDDKKSLIPDGATKAKIEYIRKNAKFLGVVLIADKGTEVPPNEVKPPLDEEGKLQKEFNELMAKTELTRTEQARLTELSKQLKQIRARKA